jgi:hypothetical protein
LLPPLPAPALLPAPPPEDEGIPAAKRPRLQAPMTFATAADEDEVTTESPDDTPTDLVTLAASSPTSAVASRTPYRSWKPEEDAKLTEAVKKYGTDWVPVAALVPGRTNQQCRSRWTDKLDPAVGNIAGKWTPGEDVKLAEAVKKHGKQWVAVAEMVFGRASHQCRLRWTRVLDPATRKSEGNWKGEEDAKLTEAVKKHGNNWVAIAALVHGRTSEECHGRWVGTLDPANFWGKGKWTLAEDAKLIGAMKIYGNNWVEVATLVPGRTNVQCRERWINTVDPGKNKGKWKPEEDAKLTRAVKTHGKQWVAVAAMLLGGRTNKRCRERWVNYLDPDRASNTVEQEEHNDGNDEALV